ncbi:error-prone DNA polymerase [Sphingorhabdus arenilitoris]|uniref:Error-prone DNA polymerase n=1 Tax=Sphingorhabdus arenilitoris TaxID=1490041 RepID=A0ABV8RJY5_9SPHN
MTADRNPPAYAELCAATHYSFLHGASSPADMVTQAAALGMTGIGIADRNSVAGVVRAHASLRSLKEEAEAQGLTPPPLKLIVGARLCFADATPDIIAYPTCRTAWGRLTRLLSAGNLRSKKGACHLLLSDLLEYQDGLLMIAAATPEQCGLLTPLCAAAPGRLWIGAAMHRKGQDARHIARLATAARALGLPLLASNDPLYAAPDQRPLHDILTCIAEKTTITRAGKLLSANAERHLKPPDEMARLFSAYPAAIAETQNLLAQVRFSLDELRYHYPEEPVPEGWDAQSWLGKIAHDAANARYGGAAPAALTAKIDEELTLIGKLDYAPYFLTVYDIVQYARSQGILCQGRGSAANSAVCYVLGITSVDPMQHDLLFSRFISEERREPPDIDVDFEHERREEVIQYIYARYGRHRAAIAATVVHYRSRSAIREVGKALGLSEDITARLSSTVWGSYSSKAPDARYGESGLDPDNPEIARLADLVRAILKFPRHLSQHVGGFVLTQDRLDETVPVHHAAMDGRTFIEWDKDDIDTLGLMKVDILALGMLSCIRKSFDLMRAHRLGDYDLVSIPREDSATYDMLCTGDSIGVFQVESRAQMNMLPRLRPREFYDLVIQVAIVRPGPIEGDMVHPYLRRRSGVEPVTLPSPAPPHDPYELQSVLGKTFGVPLFQEQAMKLAIVAADFSPADANKLRRAMATFRNVGTIHHFQEKMVEGMIARGYERDFAERCYQQIQGFGSYGFPESHALSFAILVYISAWIKCHHPPVFAAALLNSQPMGFYAPAQIVRDARDHDVEIRGIDINYSDWDNSLEPAETGPHLHALRIGLRQIDGFRTLWAQRILAARPFDSMEQLAHKAKLPQRALRLLADADACRSIGLNRRQALWEARRVQADILPLFEAANARELAEEADARLPIMTKAENVVSDYQSIKLSLTGHPMEFLRDDLRRQGILSCAELAKAKNGSFAKVAGVVLIRQRPGKGNAIFITLEDESGVANLLLWARLFERMRRPVMAARLMVASGEVQHSREGVTHLMVSRVEDCTAMLHGVAAQENLPMPMAHADEVKRPVYRQEDRQSARTQGDNRSRIQTAFPRAGHPRNVRILPKSRDFH